MINLSWSCCAYSTFSVDDIHQVVEAVTFSTIVLLTFLYYFFACCYYWFYHITIFITNLFLIFLLLFYLTSLFPLVQEKFVPSLLARKKYLLVDVIYCVHWEVTRICCMLNSYWLNWILSWHYSLYCCKYSITGWFCCCGNAIFCTGFVNNNCFNINLCNYFGAACCCAW